MATFDDAKTALGSKLVAHISPHRDYGLGFIRKALGGRNPKAAAETIQKVKSGKSPDFNGTVLNEWADWSAAFKKLAAIMVILGRFPVNKGDGIGCSGRTIDHVDSVGTWKEFRQALIEFYAIEHVRVLYPVHLRDARRIVADSESEDAPMTDSLTGNSETETL